MSSNLKYTGANIATSYYPSGQAPLDVRSIVDSFSNIQNSLNAFKTSTGDDTSYIGMMVTAYDSGNVYVLTSKNPITWKEIGTDLSKLSGVFQFKGIAEAVSPDLSYIVVCEPTIYEDDINSQPVLPIGTAVDLGGDVYYGWHAGNTYLWTESTILDSNIITYDRSQEFTTVSGVMWEDSMYYPESEVQGIADQGIVLVNQYGNKIVVDNLAYDNADTISVYSYDENGMYNTNSYLGSGRFFTYNAYEFTINQNPQIINHKHTVITASSDNSGHVYQIGENEYASNGQIWVKLGSPVEDWIIL